MFKCFPRELKKDCDARNEQYLKQVLLKKYKKIKIDFVDHSYGFNIQWTHNANRD